MATARGSTCCGSPARQTRRAILFCNDGDSLNRASLERVLEAFPQASVMARVFDRRQLIDLRGLDLAYAQRELFESAVKMGRKALGRLGIEAEEIDRVEEAYRLRDCERLERQREEVTIAPGATRFLPRIARWPIRRTRPGSKVRTAASASTGAGAMVARPMPWARTRVKPPERFFLSRAHPLDQRGTRAGKPDLIEAGGQAEAPQMGREAKRIAFRAQAEHRRKAKGEHQADGDRFAMEQAPDPGFGLDRMRETVAEVEQGAPTGPVKRSSSVTKRALARMQVAMA